MRYIVEKYCGKTYCGNAYVGSLDEAYQFADDEFCDFIRILDTEKETQLRLKIVRKGE